MAFEGGDKNNQVVHRRAVDYTLLWPIFFAPVIPIVGIALRCVQPIATTSSKKRPDVS